MRIRTVPGTTLANDRTREIIYTPPVGESLIRDKLANWEHFIHTEQPLDPLVIMAVAHYQFEAIHPFSDGNGRAGRILNLLLLVHFNLLKSPILYHSRGIIRRKEEYYQKLISVTSQQDWESWILYMLEVVEESALWTFHKIEKIRQLRQDTRKQLKAQHSNIYSAELLDVLFNQPYCRIADLTEAGIAKRQAASTYLKQLVEGGILREEKAGREKLFIHKHFLHLLLDE
jgi:Fic family protein